MLLSHFAGMVFRNKSESDCCSVALVEMSTYGINFHIPDWEITGIIQKVLLGFIPVFADHLLTFLLTKEQWFHQ